MKWPRILSMAALMATTELFLLMDRLDLVRRSQSREARSAMQIVVSFHALYRTSLAGCANKLITNSKSASATSKSTTPMVTTC